MKKKGLIELFKVSLSMPAGQRAWSKGAHIETTFFDGLGMTAFLCLIILFPSLSIGQKLQADKKYQITGTAKKGLLAMVEFDKKDAFYKLYYVDGSAISKKIKIRKYTLDLDLNFIDMNESEPEKDEAKKKYDWLKVFMANKSGMILDTFKTPDWFNDAVSKISSDTLEYKIKKIKDDHPTTFSGKDYELSCSYTDSMNNFFIGGQNYHTVTKIIRKKKVSQKTYSDVFTLFFDKNKNFVTQFCVSADSPYEITKFIQRYLRNQETQCIYQLLLEPYGTVSWYNQKLNAPHLFRIDLKNDSISEAFDFRKNDFYLEPCFPYLYNPNIHSIVFFGSDKTGKSIHLIKCKLD